MKATNNSLYVAFGDLITVGLQNLILNDMEAAPVEVELWLSWHREIAEAIEQSNGELAEEKMLFLLNQTNHPADMILRS